MIGDTETPVLDEEEKYVQALERIKAPEPEPEPKTEIPNEPAPEAGSSVVEPEKAEAPKFDPNSLTPEARAEFDKLQQQLGRERSEKQSLLGRVPRLQSELDRLRSKPSTPASPAPPAVPTDQDSKAYFDSTDWKEHERDFPKEASLQRKILEAAFARAEAAERTAQELARKVDERFGNVDSYMQEQATEREKHVLTEAHPDWQDLVLPKDEKDAATFGNVVVSKVFHEWLSVQDEDKQRWFASTSAAKNIALMDDFKRDLYLADLASGAPPAVTRRTPDIDPTPRQRQTNPVSRNASGDPEEDAYVAAIERMASR